MKFEFEHFGPLHYLIQNSGFQLFQPHQHLISFAAFGEHLTYLGSSKFVDPLQLADSRSAFAESGLQAHPLIFF
jgi:hypothetical protein